MGLTLLFAISLYTLFFSIYRYVLFSFWLSLSLSASLSLSFFHGLRVLLSLCKRAMTASNRHDSLREVTSELLGRLKRYAQ